MATVACPGCKNLMDIDVDQSDAEWECPGCGAAFLTKEFGSPTAPQRGPHEIDMELDSTPAGPAAQPPTTSSPAITEQPVATPPPNITEQAPATAPPEEPEIPDDAYVYAVEWLARGAQPSEVRQKLIDAGYLPKQAERIIQRARKLMRHAEAQQSLNPDAGAANRNMVMGGLICVAGIIITLMSCAAAGEGGGRYVIAWGAIVFGGIQFFRGWSQSNRGS